MIRFREFIGEQTLIRNPQKKDFSVEYGKYNIITKLKYKGKHVKYIGMPIPEYSRFPIREFNYSKAEKNYYSYFRRSEITLSKKVWDSVKEIKYVDF
jgi:hypothetical protein